MVNTIYAMLNQPMDMETREMFVDELEKLF